MAIQTLVTERHESRTVSPQVGDFEAPEITLLGSLDDDQGTDGLGLETESPKPLLAIIYNGI